MEPNEQPAAQPPEDIEQPPTEADLPEKSQFGQRLAGNQARPKKKWLRLVIGLVVVLLIAGAAYFLLNRHKTPAKSAGTTTPTSQVKPDKATSDGSKQTYTASGQDINLSFEYPTSWTAAPASGTDNNDKAITVTSPLTTIAGADGASTTGKVVLSIRPSSAGLSELSAGKATAAQNSVQFAYSKPSSVQYKYPFLAFVHLAGGSNPTNGFEEVIASGNTSFNKGDPITQDSLSPDPIISATFYACSTTDCASGNGATPLSISDATWQNADLFKQTLAILESLTIQ
jgi:hypothetical protein